MYIYIGIRCNIKPKKRLNEEGTRQKIEKLSNPKEEKKVVMNS